MNKGWYEPLRVSTPSISPSSKPNSRVVGIASFVERWKQLHWKKPTVDEGCMKKGGDEPHSVRLSEWNVQRFN